MTEVQKSTKHV